MRRLDNEVLNSLPEVVKTDVLETLKAYNSITLIITMDGYKTRTGLMVNGGAVGEYIVGEFKQEDVYTEEERINNYIEVFNDYPSNYKGVRDYAKLNEMKEGK